MTLKGVAKFMTCGLKNNIRNLVTFHATSRKSENLHFDQILLSIQKFRWKITEDLCFMTLKSATKFAEKLTLGSKNDRRNLLNINVSSGKSGNLHFDALVLSIAYKV